MGQRAGLTGVMIFVRLVTILGAVVSLISLEVLFRLYRKHHPERSATRTLSLPRIRVSEWIRDEQGRIVLAQSLPLLGVVRPRSRWDTAARIFFGGPRMTALKAQFSRPGR